MGHKTEIMEGVVVTYRGRQNIQNASDFRAVSDPTVVSDSQDDLPQGNTGLRSVHVAFPENEESPADHHTEILPPEGEPIKRVVGEIIFPVWATRKAIGTAIAYAPVAPEAHTDTDHLTDEDEEILRELNAEAIAQTRICEAPTPEEIERILAESAALAMQKKEESEESWHQHLLEEAGYGGHHANGNRLVAKRSGPGRPKSPATLDREADNAALEAATRLYEDTYGRY